jgi:hypothetical protein
MAVVQVSTAASREQYDSVRAHVDVAGALPAGLIVHAAAELPSGEIQIVDIFESEEALAAFGADKMTPAFRQAGISEQIAARPALVAYPAFDLVR